MIAPSAAKVALAKLEIVHARIGTEIERLKVDSDARPQRLPRPCTPERAVDRMAACIGMGPYVLGTGDYNGAGVPPHTANRFGKGIDCYGLITYAIEVRRHRVHYAHGPGSHVEDDANCDAVIFDAEHERDLWEPVYDLPRPGDIVVWPSTYDLHGHRDRIGHVGMMESVERIDTRTWNPTAPSFDLLDVIQCHAGLPAVIRSDARWWGGRECYKGLFDPSWRSRILRLVR